MWYAISFVLGILSASVVFVFSACTNTFIRSRAEKNPQSIAFQIISIMDSVLEATIFRPILVTNTKSANHGSPSSPGETKFVRNLHKLIGVESSVHVRQSFMLSLDVSGKLPKFYTEYNGGAAAFALFSVLIIFACYAVAASFAVGSQSGEYVLIAMAASLLAATAIIAVAGRLLWADGGLLNILQKLYFWPYLTIQLDNRSITVSSGWGRFISENTGDKKFDNVVSSLSRGLVMLSNIGERPTTIFSYPNFLGPFVMNDDELSALSARLNTLLDMARALPDLKYDELKI